MKHGQGEHHHHSSEPIHLYSGHVLPANARDYAGVTGNYSLDHYGDRLYAGYNIYKYVLKGENVYVKEIGYYDTSKPEIEWTELK